MGSVKKFLLYPCKDNKLLCNFVKNGRGEKHRSDFPYFYRRGTGGSDCFRRAGLGGGIRIRACCVARTPAAETPGMAGAGLRLRAPAGLFAAGILLGRPGLPPLCHHFPAFGPLDPGSRRKVKGAHCRDSLPLGRDGAPPHGPSHGRPLGTGAGNRIGLPGKRSLPHPGSLRPPPGYNLRPLRPAHPGGGTDAPGPVSPLWGHRVFRRLFHPYDRSLAFPGPGLPVHPHQ